MFPSQQELTKRENHLLSRTHCMQRRKRSIKVWKNKIKICFYCNKEGHFIRDCNARKIKDGRVHASATIEGGEPSQEKSSKEED